MFRFVLFLIILFPFAAPASDQKNKLDPIKHIIIIYLENHSFDNLFGTFPGADGIANIKNLQTQTDGTPYKILPAVTSHTKPDKRFSDILPNKPFLITKYAAYDQLVGDPLHKFYQTQQQINGGAMDKFVQYSNTGGLVMGYYEQKDSLLWQYAKEYTLADRFFTAAFGGSLLNHFWLICACTPKYENAPATLRAELNDDGSLKKDGYLTPDGYAINNIQPASTPYDARKASLQNMRLPLQTLPTIGERLTENNISWAWYNGGWDNAEKGNLGTFIPHHHPFLYFKHYDVGTKARADHLKDVSDFMEDIVRGTLPSVSFYKPIGRFDLHPGYSTLQESEEHVFSVVQAIENSTLWKDSLIIVTFDDSGGFYDHVVPPKRDRFGPGIRIPTLIISPFAKRGFIDHTPYDSTSILKLIEDKFGLAPLNDSYANAGDLTNALQ